MMNDTGHHCYVYLRSGRRIALPAQHIDRHRKAFVAKSIFYPFKNKVIVLLCDYLHETICLLCVLIIT